MAVVGYGYGYHGRILFVRREDEEEVWRVMS